LNTGQYIYDGNREIKISMDKPDSIKDVLSRSLNRDLSEIIGAYSKKRFYFPDKKLGNNI